MICYCNWFLYIEYLKVQSKIMIVSQIFCTHARVLYFASLHNILFGIKVRQTLLTVSNWNQDSKMNTLVHLSLILIIYGPCLSCKYSTEFRGDITSESLNVHYLRKPSNLFHFSWVFSCFQAKMYMLFIWCDNQLEFSRTSSAFKQKFWIFMV